MSQATEAERKAFYIEGLEADIRHNREHIAELESINNGLRRDLAGMVTKCNRLESEKADLLEALRECVTSEGAVAWKNVSYAPQRMQAINEIARAAIAKATGEAE